MADSAAPVPAAITARAFEQADEARVLEVLGAAFGRWPSLLESTSPADFFRWKYVACPFGRPASLVAESDGEVVGFLGQMPWRLTVGARGLDSIRGMDLAVHPDHHRRGVAMTLLGASRERYSTDIALAWSNPNSFSHGALLRSGRRDVDGLPRFIAPGGARLRTLARAAGRGSESSPRLPARAASAASAASVLADDAGVTELLERTGAPSGRFSTARDVGYLRWRYGAFEEYRALVVKPRERHGGADARRSGRADMAGLAIFRVARHGRFQVAHVCELLVEPGDWRTARRLLRLLRGAARADAIVCAFSSRRLARRCGFLKVPGGEALSANLPHADLEPDPRLAASWSLSLGDLELL